MGKAKLNSNWAVDKHNLRVLIVGDVGKAILFDISFMNATQSSFHKGNRPIVSMVPTRSDKNRSYLNHSQGMDETFESTFHMAGSDSPKKSGNNSF